MAAGGGKPPYKPMARPQADAADKMKKQENA